MLGLHCSELAKEILESSIAAMLGRLVIKIKAPKLDLVSGADGLKTGFVADPIAVESSSAPPQ